MKKQNKPRHDNPYQPPCFDNLPWLQPQPRDRRALPLVGVHALIVLQEMKKLLVGMTVGGAFLAAIFPRHESLTHTYQTSLWTYPSNDQSLTFTKNPPEISFRLGGRLPIGDLIPWDRLCLGLPFGAITIDYQSDNRIFQARGELAFCAVNLGCGAAVGFAIFCLMLPHLLRRKQKSAEQAAS